MYLLLRKIRAYCLLKGGFLSEKIDFNRAGLVLFLFILSYVIIYFFSVTRDAVGSAVAGIPLLNLLLPLPALDSPMLLLFPVAGFFLFYLLVGWLENYFEIDVGSIKSFLLVFFVFVLVSGLAFSAAIFFYYDNLAQLQSNGVKVALFICYADEVSCGNAIVQLNSEENMQTTPDGKQMQFSMINFWSELRKSAFYLFVVAALLSLVTALVERRFLGKKIREQSV